MHCQGNKKGKDFSATPKPCSSNNKQPEQQRAFFSTSRKHSAVTFTNTRSVMEEGFGEVLGSSCWGIWGDRQGMRSSTESNMVKRPICHADQGPVRLCEQASGTTGTVGDKQDSGLGWGWA